MKAQDDIYIDAWLDGIELTIDQWDAFERVWSEVHTWYPAPEEQDERDSALSAAVQYLLGEASPESVGRDLRAANQAVAAARAAARAVAVLAVAEGASENSLWPRLGVTRVTLRSWLGK